MSVALATLLAASSPSASAYTDYYLIGSDSGSNCQPDGNGTPKGWALTASGTTQVSEGATDANGICHVNGKDGRHGRQHHRRRRCDNGWDFREQLHRT